MASGSWLNPDNLFIKFGTAEATPGGISGIGTVGTFGEGGGYGSREVIEIRIPDMTKITATAQPIDDNFMLPKNCRIEAVQTYVDTAATSGGAAVLTIGTMQLDRATLNDATAILSAAPLADHNTLGAKKDYDIGVAGVGTKVGAAAATSPQVPCLLTAKFTTAAYTAGAITIRVIVKYP